MREKKRERIQIPYTIYGFFLTPFLTCQITVGIWQTLKRLASPNGQQCTPSFHPFNFIVLNLDPLVWPPRTAWQRPVLSLHLACWRAAPDMPQDLVMVFVLRKVFKMTLYRCTISLGVCTGEEIKKKNTYISKTYRCTEYHTRQLYFNTMDLVGVEQFSQMYASVLQCLTFTSCIGYPKIKIQNPIFSIYEAASIASIFLCAHKSNYIPKHQHILLPFTNLHLRMLEATEIKTKL